MTVLLNPWAQTVDEPDWVAGWIWCPASPTRGLDHAYFRHDFELEELPSSLRCLITAESTYELWFNGERVGIGSILSDPRWKAYDERDLTAGARVGTNTIAVVVEYLPFSSQRGASGTGAQGLAQDIGPILKGEVPPAGLFAQLEVDLPSGGARRWGTDVSWRSLPADAWWRDAPRLDDTTYQEIVDARLEPVGWTAPGFDDTGWPRASLVADPAGIAGSRQAGHSGIWRLTPREIPDHRTELVGPEQVLEFGEVLAVHWDWDRELVAERLSTERLHPLSKASIEGAQELVDGSGSMVLQGSDPLVDWRTFDGIWEPSVVLDFGLLANARLELEVEGEAGAIIEVGYAPHLAGDGVIPGVSRRTRQADRYTMREGRQTWRTHGWRHFRYLKMVGRNLSKPLVVHAVRAERLDYGGDVIGDFRCSDDGLTRLWEPSVLTTRVNALDRFMDNASRERKQWSGDVSHCVLAGLATYGPTGLLRSYLRSFFLMQMPSGHIPKLYPTLPNLKGESDLLDHALQLVIRTWDYLLHSGDVPLAHEVAPRILRFLEHCERFEDAGGRLDGPPFRIHIDWAPLDRRGVFLVANGIYLLAMEAGASVLEYSGDTDHASILRQKANRLRGSLRDAFWDPDRSRFFDALVDGVPSSMASEHALAVALMTDVASPHQAEAAIDAWWSGESDLTAAQPSFLYPLLEGLTRRGHLDKALATLADRFGTFLDRGFDTFGELWSLWGNQGGKWTGKAPDMRWYPRDSRAVAQAASAWPGYVLHQRALGVGPTGPGFMSFVIAPNPTEDLTWAEGTVATPSGPIAARWSVDPAGSTLTVEVEHPSSCRPDVTAPVGWDLVDTPYVMASEGDRTTHRWQLTRI